MDKNKRSVFRKRKISHGIKRYFQLLGIYARMDLASLMRDGKFMAIVIAADIISNISSVSGIFLLAWKFDGIGGMDRFEVLFMLAYGNIVMGFLNMIGGCNALFPSRIIGRGQWEHMFIMPLPYAVQLTVGIFPFTGSSSFLSGIAMLLAAVYHIDRVLPWWWPVEKRSIFRQEKKIVTALDNVSFRIRRGEFAAYAGPNGAGKSTTMKLLSGMLKPSEGRLSVLGMSPEKDRIALMKKLGVLFGNRTELWWDHPVIQSFEWKKVVWDIPDAVYRRNLDMVTKLLDIGEIQNTFARELSLGQRMRADLAMMLLHSPKLILLDEPTLGLDVVAKRQMIEFLKKINREEGVTILVTSHDMDDLEEMAQRILMISNGKLAYDGSFSGLREITGNLTHFTVTTDGRRPDLEGCKLLGEKHGIFEFEVDLSCLSIKALLERLSHADGIMDVEIRKAPIAQVITQLYQTWKNT